MQPLLDHFEATSLAKTDWQSIDEAARELYADESPSMRNRQRYRSLSAVLKHAAARGLRDGRQIERPSQPKGRVRWISPAEADRLIAACSTHLAPLVTFLLCTGFAKLVGAGR
jgi:integrase